MHFENYLDRKTPVLLRANGTPFYRWIHSNAYFLKLTRRAQGCPRQSKEQAQSGVVKPVLRAGQASFQNQGKGGGIQAESFGSPRFPGS
jgi:hypothetical protein